MRFFRKAQPKFVIPAYQAPSSEGPFVGYRAWKAHPWNDPRLWAMASDWCWDSPTLCIPESHLERLPENGGLHAFTTLALAAEYAAGSASLNVNIALGRVRFFGTVIEYERGYRASHAITEEIWTHPAWGEAMHQRLARRYACDVGPWSAEVTGIMECSMHSPFFLAAQNQQNMNQIYGAPNPYAPLQQLHTTTDLARLFGGGNSSG